MKGKGMMSCAFTYSLRMSQCGSPFQCAPLAPYDLVCAAPLFKTSTHPALYHSFLQHYYHDIISLTLG